MATSYPAPVTAMQVGSYFVGQYYQVLKERPELAHQFYAETSSMVRVDGDSSESGSTMLEIHSLLMSLNLATIEVKTINSLESWNGGIVVMVSGLVKIKDSSIRRKFVQTFFLAPQDKGFYVLNDIFQFFEDAPVPQHSAPMVSESRIDVQLKASSPVMDPPGNFNYVLEEESRDYVTSVNIEDNLDDEYNLQEQQHYDEVEAEGALENAYAEDNSTSLHTLEGVPVGTDAGLDDPVEEPQRKTYASILRVPKAQSASAATTQPSYGRTLPNMSDWEYNPQPTTQQPKPVSYAEPVSVVEAADDGFGEDEGLSKSVYVRNLPPTVMNADIEEVFRNFGTIRPDGVAIKIRKEIGVCYAFVEFEDIFGVQNALKASPVMVAGKPVYVEERRANTTGGVRGGRRGRGRGGYQGEGLRGRLGGQSLGRGSNLDNDYSRPRGNGSYFRGSQ